VTTTIYLSLLSLGDNLISLQLLRMLGPRAGDVVLVGTGLTYKVAELIGPAPCAFEQALPDVAAFYDLRRAGPRRALRDLRQVRRALRRFTAPPVSALFEKRDWRNPWIVPPPIRRVEPEVGVSIYHDRRDMLIRAVGPLPELPSCRRPGRVRTLTVNPAARQSFKALPRAVLEAILAYTQAHDIRVCLLDPEESCAWARRRVHRYEARPSLTQAVEQLRAADLYVGADSFFLHLAYHYAVPFFALPPKPAPYFAPPGMIEQGHWLVLDEARVPAKLFAALDQVQL
jgi:hypothetical protein